jgi:membrane-bound lytic murein transglycosylase A
MKKIISFCLLILFFCSCARTRLTHKEEAMRESKKQITLSDSLSSESFLKTLQKHIDVMKKSRQVDEQMVFGKKIISKSEYISSLEKILAAKENYVSYIKDHFDVMEVYGRNAWSEVLATGYYEPVIHGAKKPTEQFSMPIYSMPDDLVTVDLKKFDQVFKRYDYPAQLAGKIKGQTLVPYFDRNEIDVEKKLAGKNLEMAWVDPAEAFFIQIQGSGVVQFDEGNNTSSELHIGYAAQNGHPYMAIGKLLHHVIPKEEMSTQKIKAYLKTLSKEEQQKLLTKNPSYVFFKKLEGDALTYAGMEVSAGRTVATDQVFFPKGALAWLDIEEPEFKSPIDESPTEWKRKPRFVFDQDIGGAIRGGDRVDLYFGKGDDAFQKAGVMKRMGKLFYLVPKK